MYRTAVFAVLAVTAFACSDASTSTTVTPTPDIESTTTSTPPSPTTSIGTTTLPETVSSTTVNTTTTTTIVATTTSTTLAGEPFDLGPAEGDVLGVVGVAYDDVLNVRSGPGTDQPIIATLDPLFDQIVATGRHRLLTRSIWNEIEVGGTTGWANSSFMAWLGTVDDATSRYIANGFGGATPSAATMLDLGMLVADVAKSEDPPSRVTVTVAPTEGDLGEVTIDIVGLGDDSLFGIRLHIFGTPTSDGYSLKSIEEQEMCGRGITNDGLCP
jgi:hypothetical protein